MLDVVEISQRLLAELEEAGEDSLPGLMNTVLKPDELAISFSEFSAAGNNLIQTGLARMFIGRAKGVGPLMESEIHSLKLFEDTMTELIIDPVDKQWTYPGKPPWLMGTYPWIVLTDAGFVSARAILARRGYRWWEQKVPRPAR